jgi:Uma2 family endonuclease
MSAVVIQSPSRVRIPAWVKDLESFCRWTDSSDAPSRGWFSFPDGELWVDLSMEEQNHNQVKGVFAIVVGGLVLAARLGRYFHDRMRLSNAAAGLATEPDGTFFSWATLQAERVQLVPGSGENPVRSEGTPDMVLEVVSVTSVEKDLQQLPRLYYRAGIPEYWRVDPRGGRMRFEILRRGPRGYVSTRKRGGWVKSGVFGRSFRLTQRTGPDGHPEFTLDVRPA